MSIRATIIAVLLALLAVLSFGVYYYHDAYSKADHDLTLAKDAITDMQARQRDVAALDEKYTKELADAKSTINQLERDVAAGRKRLRISATCEPTAIATASLVNAGTAQLTDDAQRDYFRLRDGIATTDKMIRGLHQYVREQCLK
ncbi:lysis protein [Pectobacterium parmentieri]|uniref:lysis protein n=1 Tax=Pectobacterium parmentieri TaxID=1905730 RepID=UPI000EB14383|nr:lysis protein [Pectobacterium parmentieri]AYH33240.1 lysis protein [Pectobacterium parmentieri]MBI0520932.1 lysis protein [Pectobacterium parmentieri]